MEFFVPSRWFAIWLALLGGLFSACCGSGGEPPPPAPPPRPPDISALLSEAKQSLAVKDYSQAMQLCLQAEAIEDANAEAKYCVLLANVGSLVYSVSAIVGLVSSQFSPREYKADAFNVKSVVSSIVSDIEAQMRYIDLYAAKLAAFEDPTITLDDFPLDFDPEEVLDLIGVEATGELSVNLRGTWDKSEVMAMGAAVNGVQGLLDYLLAHKLILASTDFNFGSTEGVADLLFNNPDLFVADAADKSRIKGDHDMHKGLKNDFLAALSYLVGRDDDLARVAPKNHGLAGAIKLSAAARRSDAVVVWSDADGDGIPEKIRIPALSDITRKLYIHGNPLFSTDTFENPLPPTTWKTLAQIGRELRDNIERSGGPDITLQPILQAFADLLAHRSSNRLSGRAVPDVFGINPGKFLSSPKYLSELMPYYFQFSTDGTSVRNGLAWERETYVAPGTWYNEKLDTAAYPGAVSDFTHFNYPADDVLTPYVTVAGYEVFQFAVPVSIAPDEVRVDAKSPILYYVGWQDPTFGGLVKGDQEGEGNFATFDLFAFNRALARLTRYYCLDFSGGLLEAFDDDAYGAGNKIADCTNGF